jgi:sugar (pentulose or hexulose) kinase
MCDILATVLDRPLELLRSDEGPALGAAVTALAAFENHGRGQAGERDSLAVGDAVARMVRFREPATPIPEWRDAYAKGSKDFVKMIRALRKGG